MTLQELGKALQEKREAAGLTIDDVAARLKVSTRILRTIEQGSTEGLPHAVYTKSFVKSFGLLVGFEPDELKHHLEQLYPPEYLDETSIDNTKRQRPMDTSPVGGRSYLSIILTIVVLAALGVGGWYLATNYGDAIVDFVKQPFAAGSSTSDAPAQPAPAPNEQQRSSGMRQQHNTVAASGVSSSFGSAHAATPAPRSFESARESSATQAPAEQQAAPVAPVQEPTPPEVEPTPVAETTEPATTAEPAVAETSAAPEAPLVVEIPVEHQMQVTARRSCWVGATIDGRKEKPFTLKPGQKRVILYSKELILVLGNPSGVNLVNNGVDLGSPPPGSRALHFPPQDN